jgi:hypothetical protein
MYNQMSYPEYMTIRIAVNEKGRPFISHKQKDRRQRQHLFMVVHFPEQNTTLAL